MKYLKTKVWGILPQTLIIDAYAIYIQTGSHVDLDRVTDLGSIGNYINHIFYENEFGVVIPYSKTM